jgi:hypothetical protein
VQPAGHRFAFSEDGRLPGQQNYCRLERVVRVLKVMEDPPAYGKDQCAMALHEHGKIGLVATGSENAQKLSTSWLRRFLDLPWAEMIGSVFCFHFALADLRIIVRVLLAVAGVILLAAAIFNIVKKRKSTHALAHYRFELRWFP